MSLQGLGLRDFRCIESAELDLHDRCNLISGENASGKTSLLEAIFFLGRGRSFRTARNETLVRKGAHDTLLTGRVLRAGRSLPLGLRFGREGFEARAGGERIGSLAELASVLPVQAIDPEVHRLVEEGPQERRRYLDWGVFHVEPNFVQHWRRYQKALRQRNAALRAGQPPAVVQAWNPELVEAGEQVAEFRQRYLDRLRPHVAAVGERLLGLPVDLHLNRGWSADHSLAEAVETAWNRDAERAMTHVGPHRADVSIRVGGEIARDRVSRGQQKLTAAAMLLGQLRCDAEQGSEVAALLVDDPAAELDSGNLDRLLREVLDLPAQLFVTALDASNPSIQALPRGHTFHVEHGVLTRLI
ncbi:MAG TPA: DNA replication/repair protein RecF [Steroidobacteraceae bacterium]